MRGGEPRQEPDLSPRAALLLLGGATALAGAIGAALSGSDVAPVVCAGGAALLAGGAILHRLRRRQHGQLELRRRELEGRQEQLDRRRADLDRSAAELERLREELCHTEDQLKTALAERRDREERMLHAERLASIGTLAGGVAHEVNNPLAYVAANLDYVDQQIDALLGGELPFTTAVGEEMRIAIGDARGGVLRVRDVVRGMRSFARAGRDRKRPGDPKRELETALSLAGNEIRHRARLTVHIDELPLVENAEHELTQVFVNLLVNAAQSIPDGHSQEHEIRVDARVDVVSGCIRVEIADTGGGIAPEALPHIFDPFFPTHPVGAGAGLGLSVCHGIVRSLGGEIQVASAVGKGSTFRVVLPVARGRLAPPPALDAPRAAERRRVLVVDDDPLVGRSLQRILAPPHAVTVVTSARDALERLERGERYDLLLCDLMMPDMSGIDFDAELASRWPDAGARTAFMTGGAFTDRTREFLARTPRPIVEKPVDVAALRALVAAMPVAAGREPGRS